MPVAPVLERKTLYRLIDELPNEQMMLVADFVQRLLDADTDPLTPEELRQIEAANAQIEAGEFYTLEEVEKRLSDLS